MLAPITLQTSGLDPLLPRPLARPARRPDLAHLDVAPASVLDHQIAALGAGHRQQHIRMWQRLGSVLRLGGGRCLAAASFPCLLLSIRVGVGVAEQPRKAPSSSTANIFLARTYPLQLPAP